MADWKFDVAAGTTAADVAAASGAAKSNAIMLAVGDGVDRYDLLLQLKAFEMAIVDLDPFPPSP
ncbi:MAG: hypothetical protein H6842_13295 [Rhodospirillaceae bacterium]|nr:hypothetical protein [Rhodospirillaceae bacterium]